MAPELKWWKQKLEEGAVGIDNSWPAEVNQEQLWEDYIRWCDTMKINRRVTPTDLQRRVLGPWLGEMRRARVDGKHVRMRGLMALDQARALFDAQAGTATPWEKDQAPKEPGEDREDLPF